MSRIWRSLLAAVLVAAATHPAAAHANGDPASDVLITDDVFLPYQQPSGDQVAKLRRVIAAARSAGRPVRVAVIHDQRDLGAVTNLYGHPQEYANLLATELQNPVEPGARGHQEGLLIVMPAGFGTKNVPEGVSRELRGVELPADADPDALVAAAGWGVQELAKAGGKPIRAEFDKPKGDDGGGGVIVTVLIVVALLAVVGVLIVVRMRAGGGTPAPETGETGETGEAAQSPGGNR
jgi:hypothetical protein